MAFALTDDQQELRSVVERYLRRTLPLDRVAAIADSPAGWDSGSWDELASMGWTGVTVTPELGGAGLGFVEQAIVLEEMGRSLYSGPYLATVLALPSLSDEEQAAVAEGKTRWSIEVDGVVPDLDRVDRVVTASGAADAIGTTLVSVDPTRPIGRLDAPDRTPLRGGLDPRGLDPRGLDTAVLLVSLAAEALGVGRRALELGVAYAKERQQFGRPIGSYQAVSHALADSFGDLELARSLVYSAAWSLSGRPSSALRAASIAKAFVTDAAVSAVERAIQVHGGIGFTWEHPLHHFYKRAVWLQAFGGTPAQHRAVVRQELTARG